jgi:hypothetical protein
MAVTLALLSLGLWLGLYVDANWLSRFGALVAIVGVIFATSNLPKILEQRARGRAQVASALTNLHLLDKLQETHEVVLTPAQREALLQPYRKHDDAFVELEASRPRRRFLLVEAAIVCVGTFLNGFGQWIVGLICNP